MRKRRPREDFIEAELTLALRGAGCPVCSLARETERAVVSWLATTNIREEATMVKLIDARGLCSTHWAGVLQRLGGDLGASGARLLARIAAAAAEDVADGLVKPSPPCPVCVSVARRERSILTMLFDSLAEPHGAVAYQRSAGLCRPHVELAIDAAPEPRTLRTLASMHRRSLRELAERVDAAANDAEAREVPSRRIIALLAGSRINR
jgi:hypothetical protein